jgi:hypothetical protein
MVTDERFVRSEVAASKAEQSSKGSVQAAGGLCSLCSIARRGGVRSQELERWVPSTSLHWDYSFSDDKAGITAGIKMRRRSIDMSSPDAPVIKHVLIIKSKNVSASLSALFNLRLT